MKQSSAIGSILILAAGLTMPVRASWEPLGPYGGQLAALAVAPADEELMVVASNSVPARLFRSYNGGSTWQEFATLPYALSSAEFDPGNENILYLGTYQGIYKTTNAGSSWQYYAVTDDYIADLAIHPASPLTLHAAAGIVGTTITMGYFKSTNGGVTWSGVALDTTKGTSSCVAVDNADPSRVYVAGNSSLSNQNYPRIFRSTDGGATFANISSNLPVGFGISTLALHPTNPAIIYVGSFYPGDIYRTTNGGGSWNLVKSAPYVASIVASPAAANTAYAGADTIIYKSTDSGASWSGCGSGYSCEIKQPRKLVASPADPAKISYVDLHGFGKTTSGGATWVQSNLGISLQSVLTLACAPSAPATIYAGLDLTGVVKTTDNGASWTVLPPFLSCGNICSFAIDFTSPDTVLALEGIG